MHQRVWQSCMRGDSFPPDTGVFQFPTRARHPASGPPGAASGTPHRAPRGAASGTPEDRRAPLSKRELAVLEELTSGATNWESVEAAHVSINSVKTQLRSAFR